MSPFDKSGLGYAGESSRKNDENPNASNNKDVRKPRRNVDAPSSEKCKEKSQDNYGRNPTPTKLADGVKNTEGNGYHQRIPRQKNFKSTSRKYSSATYQSIFLGYLYSCKNFVHMEIYCGAYHNDKYNGPRQYPRSNFARRSHDLSFMNKMECFNFLNIRHMARDCNLTWVLKTMKTKLEKKVTQVSIRKQFGSESLLNTPANNTCY